MLLARYLQLKRTRRFRRIGTGLVAIGLALASIAAAPLVLEMQWQADRFAVRMKSAAQKIIPRQEARAYARLPENADREDPMRARVKVFELVGAVHAAVTAEPAKVSERAYAAVATGPAMPVTTAVQNTMNRLRIPGIKVEMQIAEGMSEKVLNKGLAWKLPYTSTPDKGGNTVIGCHRYLYTAGSQTCFNLDKVKPRDPIMVSWKGKVYHYAVREVKIVKPDEISVLQNTSTSVLTVFTCTPKFTSKFRLVVIADLVNTEAL